MRPRKLRPNVSFPVIIALIMLAVCAPVRASSAILIYEHGFATQLTYAPNGNLLPIGEASNFTQDDPVIYAFAQAAFYSANLTWQWYAPGGQLYQEATIEYQCTQSPCYIYNALQIENHPSGTLFGLWRLEVLSEGFPVYTDTFYINPTLFQDNYWNFTIARSTPSEVYGRLTVTIHPDNGTWSSYYIYLPYAANATATELTSNRTLEVATNSVGKVTVYFPGPRSTGYSFVISFEYTSDVVSLTGLTGADYAFTWLDNPWQRGNAMNSHPVNENITVTLPKGAELVDVIGHNTLDLNYNVNNGQTPKVNLVTTLQTQPFGLTVIYTDLTSTNSQHHAESFQTESGPTVERVPLQPIPLLPMTVTDVTVWAVVMSLFLLTASELTPSLYGRASFRLLISRKRMRLAALALVMLFLVLTIYQLTYSSVAVLH